MIRNILRREKAVIIQGVRTPFVKSFGKLMKADTIALSNAVVEGLITKTKLDPNHINHIIWGNVVLQTNAPNCAREIIVDLNLPKHITAHSTSMACISGLNSIIQGVGLIEAGHADCVIAGGSDSLSNGEMPIPRSFAHGLAQFVYGKRKGGIGALPDFFKEAGYNPLKWFPTAPAIAERSTGKTMGWHADMMSELYNIPRHEQDELALLSHKNAWNATEKGYFKDEIVPVKVGKGHKMVEVVEDDLIRKDLEMLKGKISKLKPVFRKPHGTITAASSSALTDGASAVLIMSETKAKALGYPTDIRLKSWAYSSIDPYPQLLLAPALGWHTALKKSAISIKDIDLFEIHEAFAGQVLTTIKCLESSEFSKKYLNMEQPVSKDPIDRKILNVNGGSIALGHPFAATGGRLVTSTANELRRRGKKHALISICAAGGLGGIAILEHTPQQLK